MSATFRNVQRFGIHDLHIKMRNQQSCYQSETIICDAEGNLVIRHFVLRVVERSKEFENYVQSYLFNTTLDYTKTSI